MGVDFLLRIFEEHANDQAIAWRDRIHDYAWLMERIRERRRRLLADQAPPGTVVLLEADFSPEAIAVFLALLQQGCIVAPLSPVHAADRERRADVAQAELLVRLLPNDRLEAARRPRSAQHPLYAELRAKAHPGLVLFSSGSTGAVKAAVHDVERLLKKSEVRRRRQRTVCFLFLDHIGGINTLFYALSNGGCLITVADRTPDEVFRAVAQHRAELLPTSPTFLNLALLAEAHQRHDLRSLQTISYGTEPMPARTLARWRALFPKIRFQQTYGLTETGILRSQSKSSDSLWVRIGGEGFQTRVLDGRLEIKADSAMLGYLNAPSPFTADGWMKTGDRVEQDGEFFKFLGRDSDLINVGGVKVHPAEIEDVIRELDNVADVVAYGKENALTGQAVGVRVQLKQAEDRRVFRSRLRRYCRPRLAEYMVPVHVECVPQIFPASAIKKMRPRGQP